MAKMWKNRWKSAWESGCKKCVQKSGKMNDEFGCVYNAKVLQSFTMNLHGVLNTFFTSVKWVVLHVFHRAYYYNYK